MLVPVVDDGLKCFRLGFYVVWFLKQCPFHAVAITCLHCQTLVLMGFATGQALRTDSLQQPESFRSAVGE